MSSNDEDGRTAGRGGGGKGSGERHKGSFCHGGWGGRVSGNNGGGRDNSNDKKKSESDEGKSKQVPKQRLSKHQQPKGPPNRAIDMTAKTTTQMAMPIPTAATTFQMQ
jgi:hypothetical protein